MKCKAPEIGSTDVSSVFLLHPVLVFSGKFDNKASVALGINMHMTYNGSVRCICHTLALALRNAITSCPEISTILSRILRLATQVNARPSIIAELIPLQSKQFSRDRIVTLDKECTARWYSKLTAFVKYIVLEPYLRSALPHGAPKLFEKSEE